MNDMQDDFLTDGAVSGRCFAWVIDALLISVLTGALWGLGAMFGVMTLGLGLPVLSVLPFVPFAYHMLSLMGGASATPGQQALGLTVRRNDDLGRPTLAQAAISTLLYYATLATSGLLLLAVLFTTRRRTIHDLLSGLVVVRLSAVETLTPPPAAWNMYRGPSAPL